MHELSIAQSIVESVLQEMERRKLTSVKSIGVRIGKLSGVMADALQFSYDAIVRDTRLSDTRLVIEEVPIKGKCKDCGELFEVDDVFFLCPKCNSGHVEILQGNEMDIAYLEVEDTDG